MSAIIFLVMSCIIFLVTCFSVALRCFLLRFCTCNFFFNIILYIVYSLI